MKKILACAGVLGNEKALARLMDIARQRKPDAVLFAGGIISPEESLPHRTDFMHVFFKSLAATGATVVAIPGPYDTPLSQFLRVAINIELVYPNVFIAHATPVIGGDWAAGGIGGLLGGEQDTADSVIRYSHSSAEYFLRSLWRIEKPIKVLLLSEPPPGKLAGAGGNPIVRELIDSYHPRFCIVAGNSRDRGIENSDPHTLVVNPGLVTEGSATLIDRPSENVVMLDF